jgi:hypothetical protein
MPLPTSAHSSCCARLPQKRQTTDLLTVEQRATESARMTHRHYGVPVAKPRPTYSGPTRAAAWSGGAIIASVIVLGFILYEVTKIVTHAGDTTSSVPRTGEARRAL